MLIGVANHKRPFYLLWPSYIKTFLYLTILSLSLFFLFVYNFLVSFFCLVSELFGRNVNKKITFQSLRILFRFVTVATVISASIYWWIWIFYIEIVISGKINFKKCCIFRQIVLVIELNAGGSIDTIFRANKFGEACEWSFRIGVLSKLECTLYVQTRT